MTMALLLDQTRYCLLSYKKRMLTFENFLLQHKLWPQEPTLKASTFLLVLGTMF